MNNSNFFLSDLHVFLAVAENGSLVTAAQKLNINHSTAFRWLKRLEQEIGHKLFEQLNSHYVLSDAGHAITPIAENIVSEITSLSMLSDRLDHHVVGEVNVTSVDALVVGYLPNVVKELRSHYPELTLKLSSNNDFLDLHKREADIAIRATHSPTGNMIGRKAASMAFGLYASREYIDRKGIPSLKQKGKGHQLCDYDSSLSHLNAAQWVKSHMASAEVVAKLASTVSLTQFAKAGLGLAAIPCFLAKTDSNLIKVLDFDRQVTSDIWIMTHPDLRHSPKIRAVLDFIFDEIQKDEQYFLGKHDSPYSA